MLKVLLDAGLQLSDLRPRYTGERCLLERHAVGGCDLCERACPHDAVRLTDRVEILSDACTGCGLCVQACPSGALEYDLLPVLGKLKDQGTANPDCNSVPASLRCAEVPGDGPEVACLARITPAHLLASAAWGQNLDLIHGSCSACKIGSADVPDAVRANRKTAESYRQNLPNAAPTARRHRVQMVSWNDLEPGSAPKLSAPAPKPVSRRGALGALWGSARRGLAQVIPDRPLPGVDGLPEPGRIGDEWVWRRRALKPRPADGAPQYWPAPAVDESCSFCQVCEVLCPTDAITRKTHLDGTIRLNLEVAACNGCNACVVSCPVGAMSLQTTRSFQDLEQIVMMRSSEPTRAPLQEPDFGSLESLD